MFQKVSKVIRLTTIASFVLILGLSVAWASTYYKSKVITADGGEIKINDNARINIPNGALTAYLNKQGTDSVKITVEMIEVGLSNKIGDNVQGLIFIFGPSG